MPDLKRLRRQLHRLAEDLHWPGTDPTAAAVDSPSEPGTPGAGQANLSGLHGGDSSGDTAASIRDSAPGVSGDNVVDLSERRARLVAAARRTAPVLVSGDSPGVEEGDDTETDAVPVARTGTDDTPEESSPGDGSLEEGADGPGDAVVAELVEDASPDSQRGALVPAGPAGAGHQVVARPVLGEEDLPAALRDDSALALPDQDQDQNDDDEGDEGGERVREVGDASGSVAVSLSRGWAGRGRGLLPVGKASKWAQSKADRRGPGIVLRRFFTGAELDGHPRTNATWCHHATKCFDQERHPSRWAGLPRLERLGLRLAGVVAVGAVGLAWVRWPGPTQLWLWATAWAVLYRACWWWVVNLRDMSHRRKWVQPTAERLVALLGIPERTPLRRFLFIPRGIHDGEQAEVAVPANFVASPEDKKAKRLVAATRTSLAMRDTAETWHLAGKCHFFTIRQRERLIVPGDVAWADPAVRGIVAGLSPSERLMGLGAGAEPVIWDMDADAAHALLSVGTGGGKSVAMSATLGQHLALGGTSTIIDFKQNSLPARGLPGVTYCRDLEVMHITLVARAREAERRSRVAADWDGSGQPVFTRELIIIEEVNATIFLLNLWWDITRRDIDPADAGRYGDPRQTKSPAVVGIKQLLFTGRERWMHLLAASQLATVNALGGTDVREQFGLRGLGRCRKNAFGMLAPEDTNPPTASRHRGRLYIYLTGDETSRETQMLRMSPTELADCARAGHQVPRSQGPEVSSPQGKHLGPVPRSQEPVAEQLRDASADDGNLVTLKAASTNKGTGVGGTTHSMLEKLRKIDPSFPQAVERSTKQGAPLLYDSEILRLYWANRNPAGMPTADDEEGEST